MRRISCKDPSTIKLVCKKEKVVERNEKEFEKGNLRESRSVARYSNPTNHVVSYFYRSSCLMIDCNMWQRLAGLSERLLREKSLSEAAERPSWPFSRELLSLRELSWRKKRKGTTTGLIGAIYVISKLVYEI